MAPLQKTPQEEQKCLQDLKQLIKEKGDRVMQEEAKGVSDDLLLLIIRCRHYKIKSAFERLQRLAYARHNYPEDVDQVYPSRLKHAKEVGCGGAAVLKHRDSKGRQIFVIQASRWDPETLTFEDAHAAMTLLGIEVLQSVETQLNGIVVIIDAGGFNLKHAKQATPGRLHKYAHVLSRAAPAKVGGTHIVNGPRLFNTTLSVVKMFLTKKIRNRIYAHGSIEALHECISPDILPICLGGKLSESEAYDHELIENLFTQEREDYYQQIISDFHKKGL